jgi:hypothetical protein
MANTIDAYQALLDRACEALFEQNKKFRNALAATGDAVSRPFDRHRGSDGDDPRSS